MNTSYPNQPLSTEEMESKAEELNRLVDSLEKGREEHRVLMAEMEAREKQEPLSLQFVNAVKQLCKDFSDRQNRPYMGDVYRALDALLVNEGIPVAPPQTEAWIGDLPYWEPCNLACDDDLNGVRNRYCDCEQARAAMAGLCLDKLGVSANCPQCSGAGEIDSGGTHPWGEPALNPCGCRSETENTRDKS